MLKLSALPFALAVMAGLSAVPSTAKAGIEYPWCAVYPESTIGATNCGFTTLAQCRATVNGLAGMCSENPAYTGPAPQPQRRTRRH